MSVNRSGFYKWRNRMKNPNDKIIQRMSDISLFEEYHQKYPSHGYRWLNAKIRLDLDISYSDNYAHRCCKFAGIKSKAKKIKVKQSKERQYVYPNLLTYDLDITVPLTVVVSDMTAFWCRNVYYELTLYMDLFNNEIIAYDLSSKRGDRMTYFNGLNELIEKKKEYGNLKLVLHTDQGSVYSSKAYNELLPLYNITHSMSRVGTPTDNGAMEAINGWMKEELFMDFNIKDKSDVPLSINEYIHFFNYERPAYALGYLTPIQYKELYA